MEVEEECATQIALLKEAMDTREANARIRELLGSLSWDDLYEFSSVTNRLWIWASEELYRRSAS